MILYIGEREIFDYLTAQNLPVAFSNTLANADKLIVSEFSEQAIRLIKEAMLINIPILGILDGFQSIIEAFGGKCEEISCAEGKQEFAVIDTSAKIYKSLETVIKVCRGKPVGIFQSLLPAELDTITRSENGDILAVANLISPGKHGNIFGLNYYISSGLTPDAQTILNNFFAL